MLFIICLLFMATCAQTQIPGTGPCRDIPGMANYDPSKLEGVWYVYGTYGDCLPLGRCRRLIFTGLPDGSTLDYDRELLTTHDTFEVHQILRYLGNATYLITDPSYITDSNITIVIWGTDYQSYHVRGNCVNAGAGSLYYLWTATKSPHPSQSVIAKIDEVLNNVGLPKQYMHIYNQTDCPSNL